MSREQGAGNREQRDDNSTAPCSLLLAPCSLFESSVKKALIIKPGAVFLVAVSGGADSTAMLAALAALRGKAEEFTLHVLHVEHGMRPAEESQNDARAVKELCKQLDVPCRVTSIPPGLIAKKAVEWGIGPEAAARFYRHRALKQEAKRIKAARILLAHTLDDALETVLMRIIRGSGPAGLALMPRERGRILRPLLELTRADVLAYLDFRGISFQTDSTNADIRYLRNRVRHKLIPCLDSFFPSWRKSLLTFAETQARTASFLSSEAEKRLPWSLSGNNGVWETAQAFMAEPSIIKEEAIFRATNMLSKGGRHLKRQSLRGFLDSCRPTADLGPVRVEVRDNKVFITSAKSNGFESGFSLVIQRPGVYKLKGLTIKAETAPEASEEVSSSPLPTPHSPFPNNFSCNFPLVLRPWKKKDFIVKAGHKRHLSDTLDRESRTGCTGFITAEDAKGTAAIIGLGPLKDAVVLKRDDVVPIEQRHLIIVTGGSDV